MVEATHGAAPGTGGRRRPLVALAGVLMAVFIVNSLVGLFAMHYDREIRTADDERLRRLVHALDTARAAQVAFKIQVQEWKNVLLRGAAPADFAQYFARFEGQERDVDQALAELAGLAPPLGLDAAAVQQAQAAHQALSVRYREGLKLFDGTDPASVRAVDAAVRGIDRPLDQTIDTLADAAAARTRAVMDETESAAAARYGTLRTVTIASMLAGLALIGAILARTGRRT